MKLPTYKRISREDIAEAPDWIGRLIYPINQVFETVYSTLNRNITFADNILSFQKSVQFTTKATYSSGGWDEISFPIPDTFRVKVSGVLMLSGRPTDDSLITSTNIGAVIWSENNRNVLINFIGGLQDSKEYVFSFMVI
ncbi:MAG: hypothetical protein IPI28_18920 [Candidatus Omnitrophica bacterium]|nr:hypothetical protein [Candidatus Omnitrophota bacterium]